MGNLVLEAFLITPPLCLKANSRVPLKSILGSKKMLLNVNIKRHFEKMPQKTFYSHVLASILINASKGL
jgi:hypothetical protein